MNEMKCIGRFINEWTCARQRERGEREINIFAGKTVNGLEADFSRLLSAFLGATVHHFLRARWRASSVRFLLIVIIDGRDSTDRD